jgi:hypothetical protein
MRREIYLTINENTEHFISSKWQIVIALDI